MNLFKSALLIVSFFFTVTVFIGFSGCKRSNGDDKAIITVKGSDTMVNLAQKWAEKFMEKNKSISVQVTGGGSSTGIAALLNRTTDIANASRTLKDTEIKKALDLKMKYTQHKVALDGIAVIVHPENEIEELTVEQLEKIFTGEYTNFKQVGGSDVSISLYGRESSSGTYEFFKNHVLQGGDFYSATQRLQSTAALAESIARDQHGIAYGGVGYFMGRSDIKILKIKKDENSPAIAPADSLTVHYDDIWSGDYPLSRYLNMFTADSTSEAVQEFLKFVKSPEGQEIVEQMEYIPLISNKK